MGWDDGLLNTCNNNGHNNRKELEREIYLISQARERYWKNIVPSLDSKDRGPRSVYKRDQLKGAIFSQYGLEQAWLVRDLLYNWICLPNFLQWRKDTINFNSEVKVYSRLTFSERRARTRKLEEKENKFLWLQGNQLQENFSSRAGSFGIMPGPPIVEKLDHK